MIKSGLRLLGCGPWLGADTLVLAMNGGIPNDYFSRRPTLTVGSTVRVLHGTDLASAESIRRSGLNRESMSACCLGSWAFWTTYELRRAMMYATLNPAQGTPAVVGFDLPGDLVRHWMAMVPPLVGEDVIDLAFYFEPDTFPAINRVMHNCSVQTVTELNLSFGEA